MAAKKPAAKKVEKKTPARKRAAKVETKTEVATKAAPAKADPTPAAKLAVLATATEALQFARHRLRVANSYNDSFQRAAKVEEASKEVEEAEAAYEKAKADVV